MLVLSRKVNQELIIDDNIKIIVNKIQPNRITLAIEAPKDVRILRGELDATDAGKYAQHGCVNNTEAKEKTGA